METLQYMLYLLDIFMETLSDKAIKRVCKTFIRQFEPARRLQSCKPSLHQKAGTCPYETKRDSPINLPCHPLLLKS